MCTVWRSLCMWGGSRGSGACSVRIDRGLRRGVSPDLWLCRSPALRGSPAVRRRGTAVRISTVRICELTCSKRATSARHPHPLTAYRHPTRRHRSTVHLQRSGRSPPRPRQAHWQSSGQAKPPGRAHWGRWHGMGHTRAGGAARPIGIFESAIGLITVITAPNWPIGQLRNLRYLRRPIGQSASPNRPSYLRYSTCKRSQSAQSHPKVRNVRRKVMHPEQLRVRWL